MSATRLLVSLLLFSGCGGAAIKAYTPPEVAVWRIPSDALLQAAGEVVLDRGWRIVDLDDTRLVAVSRPEEVGGVLTRGRWTFKVVAQGMTVSRRMEVQWEPKGPWSWSAEVCENYQYLSERQIVDAIHLRLANNEANPNLPDLEYLVRVSSH